MTRHFLAKGKVQRVMFRQTLIRGAQKRGLRAGATNLPGGREVSFAVDGEESVIAEFVEALQVMDPLNSWGASTEEVIEAGQGRCVEEHEVNTENVDGFSWNPNIEMYL